MAVGIIDKQLTIVYGAVLFVVSGKTIHTVYEMKKQVVIVLKLS